MNSRTSFFNKSLIRSDLRRLWWISALHTIGIFLFYTFLYLDQYTGEYGYLPTGVYTDFGTSPIYRMSPAFYVLAILVPVGLSAFLFSYLQNNSSMTCLHGIPVSRKTHYFSHLLSGGIMLLIPVLINGLILLMFRTNKNVAESYRIIDLFWLLASGLIYELLSFTAASFIMMIVGNAFAGFCLTFAVAALPAVAESFVFYFCEQQLFGYVYNGDYSLTQLLYALPDEMLTSGKWILYLALSVVFVLAGYGLYRIRNLENHSEIIAFPKLRPVFVYGVGICFGCGGYLYFSEIIGSDNILFLIPIGVLGIVIAQMLVQKSFRIFKTVYKPVIGFICFVLLMYGAFAVDILGYEKKVPKPEEVASVSFRDEQNTNRMLTSDNRIARTIDSYDYSVSDLEGLSLVENLHKAIITKRNDPNRDYQHSYGLMLKYTLKNGKTLVRQYTFDADELLDSLSPVQNLPQMRAADFPMLANNKRSYTSVAIIDQRVPEDKNNPYRNGITDPQIVQELINALSKDLSEIPVESFLYRRETNLQINVSFTQAARYQDTGEMVPEDKLGISTEHYIIRREYKNTLAVLKKIGFYDALPKADSIEGIDVSYYRGDARVYHVTEEEITAQTQTEAGISKITDPDQIAKIYQILGDFYEVKDYGADAELSILYKNGSVATLAINSWDEVWNGILKN